MQKIYYLFSSNGNNEALSLYEDKNYSDIPKLQTGVYSMGTLFSKMLTILIPYMEADVNTYNKVLEDNLSAFSKENSSFPNIVSMDDSAKIIFGRLLKTSFIHSSDIQDKRITCRLKNLLKYIKICQKEWQHSTIETLNILALKGGGNVAQYSTYTMGEFNEVEESEPCNMQKLLNDVDNEYRELYPQNPKNRQSRKLFEIKQPIYTQKNTGRTLEHPIYAYPISNMEDFILATLKCIFEQRYFLSKCKCCKNLFITRNKKRMYCPKQNSKSSEKSCYLKEKLKRQTKHEKKESVRLHKNLRTMLYNKCVTAKNKELENANLLVYNKFLKDSKDWRNKIKKGEYTEENYVVWLKSNYARKYKNE